MGLEEEDDDDDNDNNDNNDNNDTETPDPVQARIPSHPGIKYPVRGIPPSDDTKSEGGVSPTGLFFPGHDGDGGLARFQSCSDAVGFSSKIIKSDQKCKNKNHT